MKNSVASFEIVKNPKLFKQGHSLFTGQFFSGTISFKAKNLKFKCFTHMLHLRKDEVSRAFILKKLGKHS